MLYSTEQFKSIAYGDAHSKWGINKLPVPKELISDFRQWFIENSIVYSPPSQVTEDELQTFSRSIHIEPGLCYGNSQKITLLNAKYNYFEGFYYVDGRDYDPVIRHAFNVTGAYPKPTLKDFSVSVITPQPPVLNYIGVPIPTEFVVSAINFLEPDYFGFLTGRLNRSLLRPYFFECIGRKDLLKDKFFYHPEE